MSTEVVFRRDAGVATITFDGPADQNRLTRDALLALQGVVDELAADGDTQAVVVTGSGAEYFSMGILSPSVRAGYTKEPVLARSHDVDEGAAAHRAGRAPRFTGR